MERILKKATADRPDTSTETGKFEGNPHSVRNVNQAQGPRTGNAGAHEAKRANFLDAKAERAPLADAIEQAFAGRARELEANPGLHEIAGAGGIDSNSQVRRFSARKNKYRD